MNITFSTKKLEKWANNDRQRIKDLGTQRASILLLRLTQLADAGTLEDVRYLPGHYHELTGDRKGKWACNLDQPYRLIFKPHNDPVPINEA